LGKDDFKIPILLKQMEKDPQVVHDLLRMFRLSLKEYNYGFSNHPPNKYFTIEVQR
jgi:hypothetical protein